MARLPPSPDPFSDVRAALGDLLETARRDLAESIRAWDRLSQLYISHLEASGDSVVDRQHFSVWLVTNFFSARTTSTSTSTPTSTSAEDRDKAKESGPGPITVPALVDIIFEARYGKERQQCKSSVHTSQKQCARNLDLSIWALYLVFGSTVAQSRRSLQLIIQHKRYIAKAPLADFLVSLHHARSQRTRLPHWQCPDTNFRPQDVSTAVAAKYGPSTSSKTDTTPTIEGDRDDRDQTNGDTSVPAVSADLEPEPSPELGRRQEVLRPDQSVLVDYSSGDEQAAKSQKPEETAKSQEPEEGDDDLSDVDDNGFPAWNDDMSSLDSDAEGPDTNKCPDTPCLPLSSNVQDRRRKGRDIGAGAGRLEVQQPPFTIKSSPPPEFDDKERDASKFFLEAFGRGSLRVRAVASLERGSWVSDAAIHSLVGLFPCPKGYGVFDSLLAGGSNVPARAAKKLHDVTVALFPTHVNGDHWVLLVYSAHAHCISIYDSMRSNNRSKYGDAIERVKQTLATVAGDSPPLALEHRYPECPQQGNGSDCGVFMLATMEAILRTESCDIKWESSQPDPEAMRIYYACLLQTNGLGCPRTLVQYIANWQTLDFRVQINHERLLRRLDQASTMARLQREVSSKYNRLEYYATSLLSFHIRFQAAYKGGCEAASSSSGSELLSNLVCHSQAVIQAADKLLNSDTPLNLTALVRSGIEATRFTTQAFLSQVDESKVNGVGGGAGLDWAAAECLLLLGVIRYTSEKFEEALQDATLFRLVH